MPYTLKNGTTLILTEITATQLSELEDHVLTQQLDPEDIHALCTHVPDFTTREQLLLILDRCTQFTPQNDLNKVYLFALYVQEAIKTESHTAKASYLSDNINAILQTGIDSPVFNMVKGYYFIYLNKIENAAFLLTRSNGTIAEVGLKIIDTLSGRRVHGGSAVDELCRWYMRRKERKVAPDEDRTKEPDENSLDNLIKVLAEENDVAALKKHLTVRCEGFLSDLNYHIGKCYHIEMNYLKAVEHYRRSTHPSAIYNLMRITRTVTSEDVCYKNILNYIYLINNQNDRITVDKDDFSIYRVKKEERWCANALTGYFSLIGSGEIETHIVVNNLAYFYIKCLKENEIQAINKLCENLISKYGNIIQVLEEAPDTNQHGLDLLSDTKHGDDNPTFRVVNLHLAYLLSQAQDQTSLYNLSFFLKTQPALKVLQMIAMPTVNVLMRIGILSNSLDIVTELIALDKNAGATLIGFHYLKNNNIKTAKDSFRSLTKAENSDYALYGYVALAYAYYKQRPFKREHLENGISLLKEGLSRFRNSYLIAYNLGVLLSMKGESESALRIFSAIARDERNNEKLRVLCNEAMQSINKHRDEDLKGTSHIDKGGENVKRLKK